MSPRFPGYVRVEVTPDGRLLVEETVTTVEAFAAQLDGLAANPPVVLYHRSNPTEEPPPIAKDVLDVIIGHRLAVRLVPEDINAPDYSPPPLPD